MSPNSVCLVSRNNQGSGTHRGKTIWRYMEKISQGERSQKRLSSLDLGLVASRTLRIDISVV